MHLSLRRASAAIAVALAMGASLQAGAQVPGTGYLGSLTALTPADDGTAGGTCTQSPRTEQAENQLPGTTAWTIPVGHDNDTLLGYLDHTSARCGDTVDVRVSGKGDVVVSAYRVGWYGGKGGRLVWTSSPRPASSGGWTQDPTTRMIETSWPVTTKFQVTPDWTPGVYVLEVRPAGSHRQIRNGAVMPLIVEGDGQNPLLAVASTLTWSAYNVYGGYSTYVAPTRPEDRATASSADRPLTGSGLRHVQTFDLPLARFLSRLNLDVDWTTDEELDARPHQASDHKGLIFPGHSEYWTSRMYDAVESARNNGVNVAFLGADPVYWQTRLSASPLGARRRMAIYRDASRDPDSANGNSGLTVRWRDAPLDRDESELVGTTYSRSNIHAGMQVQDAPEWMLAGTGLSKGSSLLNAAGNEVDTFSKAQGATPPNLQVVLRGAYADPGAAIGEFEAVYYTIPGGGAVFAAGTTAWPCDLEADCWFSSVPEATAQAMRFMTANILRGFASSGFAAEHPSQSSDLPPLPLFWNQLPQNLRGTAGPRSYGGIDDD